MSGAYGGGARTNVLASTTVTDFVTRGATEAETSVNGANAAIPNVAPVPFVEFGVAKTPDALRLAGHARNGPAANVPSAHQAIGVSFLQMLPIRM
jgi:hypothetical protein